MIERLNRTYKASYRPTNGFDSIDGANYDLALWVAYYNFLRPHKHAGYKVLIQYFFKSGLHQNIRLKIFSHIFSLEAL
jgi:transposase InsO family protein